MPPNPRVGWGGQPFNNTPTHVKELQKIYRYCVYQERSPREVRDKLSSYGLPEQQIEQILLQLNQEGYLDAQRFAKTFAGSKFRIRKWGRIKIIQKLETHGLDQQSIMLGLQEIEEHDYRSTLTEIIIKKNTEIDDDDDRQRKHKVARYAIFKGYEPEWVWKIIETTLE